MKNMNMVEFLVELQKSGVNVYLTEEGSKIFLELMAAQNNGSSTVQNAG